MSSRCLCARLAQLSLAARPNLTRPFSTTTANFKVPPESPRWIQVPVPPQSQASEEKLPKVKGTLPVPRDPFPRKEGTRKIEIEYFKETVHRPSRASALRHVEPGSRLEHRRRMAKSRRKNLIIALRGLYERKKKRVNAAAAASKKRLNSHKEAANVKERWDDRMTRSSVLSSLAETQSVQLDPQRYERAAESKAKTAVLAQQKSEARQDALMEMYINASNFIVTEEELNTELDKLFSESYWKGQGKSMLHDSDNGWDVWGVPPTVQSMMDDMLRKEQRAIDFQQSEQDRTVKRQKTIAEELTGGKME